MARYRFPRASPVAPYRQSLDLYRTADEPAFQRCMKRPCLMRQNLILDRDVWPPAGAILRRKQSGEGFRQRLPDSAQGGRTYPDGHAASEVHHADRVGRRWGGACCFVQALPQFRFDAWRQMMEQGEMGRELIALGRKVRAPQIIQPREIPRTEQGRDDQWGAISRHRPPPPLQARLPPKAPDGRSVSRG